jgi:putative ABC transport system permease protein
LKHYTGFSGDKSDANPQTTIQFNVDGTNKNKLAFSKAIGKLENSKVLLTDKQHFKEMYANLTGGFLFIGIIFAVSFMLATGLIIYYKQISEGADDQKRFDILQKVGMSHSEVKRSINSQVIWVFVLPIATAVLHLLVASPMILKMLGIFGLNNVPLFIKTTFITVVVFALIYFVIYKQTSKIYYQLVERK